MKSPKKTSKEQPFPTQDEARRINVLQEKVLSEFRTFGESLSAVREDVNSLKPRFDTLEQKVDVLELAVRTNGKDIRSLKETVQGTTNAIQGMQIDLKNMNGRLVVVEAKITS